MTEPLRRNKEKKLTVSFFKRVCFAYMAIFMLLLFFKTPEATSQWVKRGLDTCVESLIPSLFPFMVISSLLISGGAGERIGALFKAPVGALFGLSARGTSALLMGWLCGFPIGARSAAKLYRDGKISREELERIVCVSGVPSPAFLINVAGKSMLNCAGEGVALYAICLMTCILIGIMMKITSGRRCPETVPLRRDTEFGGAEVFTGAVADSVSGMLSVCGFVVFFSAFVGALDSYLTIFWGEHRLAGAAFGFFELTVGISRISELDIPRSALFSLCAATSTWSGMSVHLQVISLCSDTDLCVSKYFFINALKACVGALLAVVLLPLLRLCL